MVESCVIDVYAINATVTLREKVRHFQNGLTFPRTVKHPECCTQTERRTPFNRIIGHNRKRGDISQIFFHFQFRVLLSVALFEFRQKVHNGLDSSFAVYIRQIIAFHKITFVCALHFVGHVYVSLKHRLHFCQFRIDRSTLLLFLCHYASPSLVPIIPTKDLHSKNTAIISSSRKQSRIAALYTKKPPRAPPQWEESSTVFAYRVCCGLKLLLSSAKNNSTFFCAFINCCISSRALR